MKHTVLMDDGQGLASPRSRVPSRFNRRMEADSHRAERLQKLESPNLRPKIAPGSPAVHEPNMTTVLWNLQMNPRAVAGEFVRETAGGQERVVRCIQDEGGHLDRR